MSTSGASCTPDTLPSPPFIPINRIPNFRTIGSHPTKDGKRTRSDLVYRCGAPQGYAEDTLAVLQKLKVTTFYDLRSEREIERLRDRMPVTEYAGIKRVFAPVFLNRDLSPETLGRRLRDYAETGPQGFVRAYTEILDEGTGAYRTVFEHVRDRPEEPLVIHCSAGKDRTGVLVALMLSLVGVPDEEVANEYQLTEIGLRDQVEEWIPHMLKEPAYNNDADTVRRSLSSRKESMMETLKMLHEKWGGADGYLVKGLEFSDADVKKIKSNLLA